MGRLISIFVVCTFFFILSFSASAQKDNHQTEKEETTISFIEYEGLRNKHVQARIYENWNGTITVSIECNSPINDKLLYEIYLTFNDPDAVMPFQRDLVLPVQEFYPLEEDARDDRMEMSFIRHYPDWNGAYHILEASSGGIYFQKYNETEYLISGTFVLDSRNAETIKFLHYGEFTTDLVLISQYIWGNREDIDNNKGKLSIGNEEIDTPYGFYREDPGYYRYYVADRWLSLDKALEYGVFFDTSSVGLPIGKFAQSNTEELLRVGFFDKDTTILPEEYEVTITYNKKKRNYSIKYRLTLPDQRIVRGDYIGRMPEVQLD